MISLAEFELAKAILIWQSDEPLPLDHAAYLMEMGFDVEALEKEYRP